MAKPKKTIPQIKWTVYIPEPISNRAELAITDSLSGRVKYAEKSKLVARLLKQWLDAPKTVANTDMAAAETAVLANLDPYQLGAAALGLTHLEFKKLVLMQAYNVAPTAPEVTKALREYLRQEGDKENGH